MTFVVMIFQYYHNVSFMHWFMSVCVCVFESMYVFEARYSRDLGSNQRPMDKISIALPLSYLDERASEYNCVCVCMYVWLMSVCV